MKHSWMVFFMILVCSCKGQKETVKDTAGVRLLAKEQFVPTESGQLESLVATSFKELNAFYREINKTRKPRLPVPQVDFSKEVVILVCAGELLEELELVKVSVEKDTYRIQSVVPSSDTNKVAPLSFYVFSVFKPAKEINIITRLSVDN